MALALPHSVFFHIPKTGGGWVRRAIAQAGIPAVERGRCPRMGSVRHSGFEEADTRGKFTFTFVRHPLDWYASFWSFRMFTGWRTEEPLESCMSVEFEPFIRNVLRRFPEGYLSKFYEFYLGSPPGGLCFVGRTENLVEDLVKALTLAGEDFDEERLRATPRINASVLRPLWSPRLREAVLRAESGILERFGYR